MSKIVGYARVSTSEQNLDRQIKALEQYLRKTYARVFAITDEKGVFPNGDLAFFTRNGYRDNGVIFEDQAYCKLHLVSKNLK